MPLEGELLVRIRSRRGRVIHAEVRAERPRVASRLFPGRLAREAAPLARSLFAVCGRSQAIAAQAAGEAIRGEPAEAAERRARERRIAAETLVEHAWRLLVDAPRLAGREPAIAALAEGRRALAPFLADTKDMPRATEALDWSRGTLLGRDPADFLAIDSLDAFREWLRWCATPVAGTCAQLLADDPGLGASDVGLLAPGSDAWIGRPLADAIDDDSDFDAHPHLDGIPRETGPLARVVDHPLAAAAIGAWGRGFGARLVARLVESAALLDALAGKAAGHPATRPLEARHGAATTGAAAAISWVETARGLLVHRVALDGERIASYRIVAPTEWNFHPDGAFARGARDLAGGDAGTIEARVRRLVGSLDPCVAVRYEASHA